MKFLYILALFPCLLIAQTKNADINWGEELQLGRFGTVNDIVGEKGKGFYTVIKEKKIYKVLHYNDQMQVQKQAELNLVYKGKEQTFEFLLPTEKGLLLVTSFINIKHKKKYLFYERLDENLASDKQLVGVGEVSYQKRFYNGYVNYLVSRDKSKVAFYFSEPGSKDEMVKYHFVVFNAQMEKLAQGEFQEKENDILRIKQFQLDNEGNFYIMMTRYLEKEQRKMAKKSGHPTYFYEIYPFMFPFTKQPEKIVINPEKIFIQELRLDVNQNDELIAGGLFSMGIGGIKGSVFYSFDKHTSTIISENKKDFGFSFIREGMSEKEEAKSKKREAKKGVEPTLYSCKLREMVLKEDGGCILMGEQYRMYTTTTTTTTNGRTTTSTTYHYIYGDIIVISIDPEGHIEWNKKIEKCQRSRNDNGIFSSYSLFVKGNSLHFIFNEMPENATGYNDECYYPYVKSERILLMVTVDSGGNITRETLQKRQPGDVICMPNYSRDISDTEQVIYGRKRKDFAFGKVTFN